MRPSDATIGTAMLVLCLAVAPIATACGSDDGTAATTDRPAPSSPTSSPASTPPPGATTTTPPPAPTATSPATTTTVDTNTLASGSGCTPGPGDLADGEWFGLVADATVDDIEFDLACWFTGDAAVIASAEDGQESPPPNDYYVRNANSALRTVPVAADAQVTWLANVGDPASAVTTDHPAWLVGRAARGSSFQPGVWITVTGGDVTEIEEQYTP